MADNNSKKPMALLLLVVVAVLVVILISDPNKAETPIEEAQTEAPTASEEATPTEEDTDNIEILENNLVKIKPNFQIKIFPP